MGDHSSSWLLGSEILKSKPPTIKYDNQTINLADDFCYFTDEVKRLVEKHGEIRFVFGFDS